jgi:hypothetical protein
MASAMGARWWKWLAGMLAIGLALALATLAADRLHSRPLGEAEFRDGTGSDRPAEDEGSGSGMIEEVGPWGRLRIVPFWLAVDEDQITRMPWYQFAVCPVQYPPWGFPGWSRERLDAFLLQPAFDGAVRTALASLARCVPEGCMITPTLELARQLGSEARSEIYRVQFDNDVSPWPGLTILRDPVNLKSWLEESQLDPALQEEVRRRTYNLGGSVAFSDVPLLCVMLKDEQGHQDMIRAWFFTRALMVKLRLNPGDDLEAIGKYWQRNTRRDVMPLLKAGAHVKGGVSIDVSYLLPRPVRGLLNSFPLDAEAQENCFWTAKQFNEGEAVGAFSDAEAEGTWPGPDYREVPEEDMSLGDVLTWRRASGRLLHVAVHIAADVFLTKNGTNLAKPWVLMTRKDLDRLYGFRAVKVLAYRRIER